MKFGLILNTQFLAGEDARVNHFLLRLQWPGVPHPRVLEQIELVGRDLIPSLRSA